MPRLSRWFLCAAAFYLLGGVTAGALMLSAPAIGVTIPGWVLPLHIEFVMIGWAVQLAMGIAYWILPRHRSDHGRGNEPLAWAAFLTLNAGVLLAGTGWLITPAGGLPALGHGAELLGAIGFAINIWRRLPRSIAPPLRPLPIL
ncbi:MAG: hypothetical protein ABI679_02725 [Gemmatimonadota bacterium]